jgi:hypothetical protein
MFYMPKVFAYAATQIVRRDIVNSLRTGDSSKEEYIKLAIEDGYKHNIYTTWVYVLYAKSHAHVCHYIAFTYSPRPAR